MTNKTQHLPDLDSEINRLVILDGKVTVKLIAVGFLFARVEHNGKKWDVMVKRLRKMEKQ